VTAGRALASGDVVLPGVPPSALASAGPWRVWLFGRPEQVERVAIELKLGAVSAAQVLAELIARLGRHRGLARLEGHWGAVVSDGARTWLVRDRVGLGGWWWRRGSEGIEFAAHPAALGVAPAADLLREVVRHGALPAPRTVFPGVAKVPPGEALRLEGGRAAREVWWTPGQPPRGRAGSRERWDRAVSHALALGVRRAAQASHVAPGNLLRVEGLGEGDALLAGGLADVQPPVVRVPGGHADGGDFGDIGAVLELIGRMPEPGLSSLARRAAAAVAGGAERAGIEGVVLGGGAASLLGRGLPRGGALPGAWTAAWRGPLAEGTLVPLAALGPVRPVWVHPIVLGVVAQVPAGHLRGMRGDMAARLGVGAAVGAGGAKNGGVVSASARSALAEAVAAWRGEGDGLGPVPVGEAAQVRWVEVVAWRARRTSV